MAAALAVAPMTVLGPDQVCGCWPSIIPFPLVLFYQKQKRQKSIFDVQARCTSSVHFIISPLQKHSIFHPRNISFFLVNQTIGPVLFSIVLLAMALQGFKQGSCQTLPGTLCKHSRSSTIELHLHNRQQLQYCTWIRSAFQQASHCKNSIVNLNFFPLDMYYNGSGINCWSHFFWSQK